MRSETEQSLWTAQISPPPPVYICFCRGTDILTPDGYRKIETLRIGDLIINEMGAAKPIRWISYTTASIMEMFRDPNRRPVRIPANAIEPGVPSSDLFVSAQHRVVLEDASAELLFGQNKVLAIAKHLVGSIAEWAMPASTVEYYHLLLDSHDIVIANNLASESFQLSLRGFAGMSHEAQRSLTEALPDAELQEYFNKADVLPTLAAFETKVLTKHMFKDNTCPALPADERVEFQTLIAA